MSGWVGTTYARSEDQASLQAAAFLCWQLESGAYPAMLECDGEPLELQGAFSCL